MLGDKPNETPLYQPPPDAEWLKAVRSLLREEIENFPEDQAKNLGHVMGMISDIGAGKIDAGIEVMRADHSWLARQRERTEQFGRTFFFAVITSAVGGTALAIWAGIKALLGEK